MIILNSYYTTIWQVTYVYIESQIIQYNMMYFRLGSTVYSYTF